MSSRRLSAALGPLIALVLIGGVIAAVMGGSDDADTDFAAEPTDEPTFTEAPTEEATAAQSPTAEPTATASTQAKPTASASAEPETSPTPEPIASEGGAAPPGGATPPPATPQPAPTSDADDIGSQPAVDDGALTGGWVGGTPNTGTAISAAGLVLLAIGGGLLWLRRSRA